MDIQSQLRANPDDALEIKDDFQAVEFLHSIGIADAFKDPEAMGICRPTIRICGSDAFKTHIIVAFHFSGCSRLQENGYLVQCIPRSGFESTASAAGFIEGVIRNPTLREFQIVVVASPKRN